MIANLLASLLGVADLIVPDQPLWSRALLIGLLVAVCGLIAVIDWRQRIIPNGCNAAVALLGLAFVAWRGIEAALWSAAQGIAVFALFWAIRALYRALRPHHGLGLGDVKFMGAAGIWVGLQGVAPLLLVACTAALLFIGVERWRGQTISARFAIPFGPFLALGLVVVIGSSLG